MMLEMITFFTSTSKPRNLLDQLWVSGRAGTSCLISRISAAAS